MPAIKWPYLVGACAPTMHALLRRRSRPPLRVALATVALLVGCTGEVSPGGGPAGGSVPDVPGSDPLSPSACVSSFVKTRVRKLTDAHYAAMVRQLLPGIEPEGVTTPGAEGAKRVDEESLLVRGGLAGQYWDGALVTASRVDVAQFVPCTPAAPDAALERSCAEQFIADFAGRAFRRPLLAEDMTPLMALYDVGAETSFEQGIELLIAGVLQSADFLYRTELGAAASAGQEVVLSPHEIASLLSFAFFGTGPDDALYAAAADGSLSTPEAVAAQIQRLIALPEVQDRLVDALTDLLGAGKALTAERDQQLYPALTPALREAMAAEVDHLVRNNVFGGKPLTELFTSREAFVTDELARFYGLPGVPAPGVVELPATERAGILTRAAALLSLPEGDRVVHRGLNISEELLCLITPPPPPAAVAEIEETIAFGYSARKLAELRAEKALCSACHAHFDGIGLAFEHYDLDGRFLTARADEEGPVDASATLTLSGQLVQFNNALELSDMLARNDDVASCVSGHVTETLMGHHLEPAEKCGLEGTLGSWKGDDRALGSLISQVASSRFFITRQH